MKISNMIHGVDLHACGEPGRVIVGGVLDVPGESMFDKMQYLSQNSDSLRLRMLREPRGYPAANCNLILPSNNPEAVAGFVIMEQTEYPGMSGTNTICVVTTLIETGMVDVTEPFTEFKLETPAGLISISAEVRDSKVVNVTFENVPAFSVYTNKSISVPEIGEVAEMVKAIAAEKFQVVHPLNKDISGITIAVVSGPPENSDATLKNAVVVSTGELDWDKPETWKGVIDRSPCGTGTCAKMASLYAKNLLDLDTDFIHEGILGTTFTGRLIRKTRVGKFDAVIPTISGRAWITGFAQYVVDENDPFPEGFTIGDIWGGN